MATSDQIGRAASSDRPPAGTERMASDHLVALPAGSPQGDATERAGAVHMNRRLANRHHCEGRCDRPEHTRDVAAGVEILEALGLTPYRKEAP